MDKRPGALKRAIKVFSEKGSKDVSRLRVGVDYKIAPHAHLVEFGTGERKQGTSSRKNRTIIKKWGGRRTGKMPAFPFMRPAFESTKERVLQAFVEKIQTYLITKLNKTR